MSNTNSGGQTWREQWYEIIFEADTRAGKAFDVILLIAILLSVLVVMLESVGEISNQYGFYLVRAEWFFTALFTLEYIARIVCSRRPMRYVVSFYGVIDLLAILPTYLILVLPPGAQRLTVVRSLRLLRAFRIFKLAHMLSEASALRSAVWASRAKIAVFLTFVVIVIVIVGSAMHVIEGQMHVIEGQEREDSGFESIPQSMYWAIVTLTTVGYGDIAPQTVLGQMLAGVVMILGYSIIAVPTGIVSAELVKGSRGNLSTQACLECSLEGHDADARHCKYCGAAL